MPVDTVVPNYRFEGGEGRTATPRCPIVDKAVVLSDMIEREG
jgi:hypothetical protein